MSPEQMVGRLLAIVDKDLQKVMSDPTKVGYDRAMALEHATKVRNDIPAWVDALYHSTVVVKPPKVIKAKSQYQDDVLVLVDGLYVAVQAFLCLPGGKKLKLMKLEEVSGWRTLRLNVPIPHLFMSFFLNNGESALLDQDGELASRIVQLTSALTNPVLEAHEEAKRLAPDRASTAPEDMGRLAEKLLPFLDNNPLAALSPDSLSLIFKTPWRELERIVGFLKENRALAGGADPESVEYVLRLMTAKKVMDS